MAFTIIPISCLVILEVLFAFISIKSRRFRTIFDGKPSLIIVNGKINYKEMIKQRYSLDDLLVSLRQKEIRDIDMVEYAFLEPNGELSVFKYNFFRLKSPYPQALILDGELQNKVLKYIKKTPEWVEDELLKNNLTIKDIFYAFYKNNKIFIIKKNDLNWLLLVLIPQILMSIIYIFEASINVIIDTEKIESLIYEIRGKQVMLDSEILVTKWHDKEY